MMERRMRKVKKRSLKKCTEDDMQEKEIQRQADIMPSVALLLLGQISGLVYAAHRLRIFIIRMVSLQHRG